MALPAGMEACLVTLHLTEALVDSPTDPDRDPDTIPIAGAKVVFRASLNPAVVRIPSADPPTVVSLAPVTVHTNANGDMVSPDGQLGVYLIPSTDERLDPHGWTWSVTITKPEVGLSITTQFVTTPGGHVDLGDVVPVPPNPGTALLQWETAVTATQTARDEAVAAAADVAGAVDAAAQVVIGATIDEVNTARDQAVAHTELLAAPAIGQVAGYVQGVGGGTVRDALNARYARVVTPEAFGAIGDGVANDTAAITSALAAISTGGALLISRPHKTVGEIAVNLSSAAVKLIEARDGGALVTTGVANGAAGVRLIGAKNLTVRNLTLTGSGAGVVGAGTGAYGLHVTGADHLTIEGGDYSLTAREAIRVADSTDVRITGVTVHDACNAFALGAIQVINSPDAVIDRCLVRAVGYKGISASASTAAGQTNRVALTRNTVQDIGAGDGLFVAGYADFAITDNIVADVDGNGDGIKVSVAGTGPHSRSTRGVIAGNVVSNVGGGGWGVRLTGCTYVTVTGNQVHTVAGGVVLASEAGLGATNNTIVGNSISSTTTTYGIDVQDNANSTFVAGNVIQSALSAGVLVRAATGVTVRDNRVRNSGFPVRTLAGAVAVTVNNDGDGIESHAGDAVRVAHQVLPISTTADATLTAYSHGRLYHITSGTVTLTLPSAADVLDGWYVDIRNISGNPATVTRVGANTIDGAATLNVPTGTSVRLFRRTASVFSVY